MKNLFSSFKKFSVLILSFLFAFIIFMGIAVVYAWTEPVSAPPAGNVSAPVNVSTNSQTLLGSKRINRTGASDVLSLATGLGVDGVFHGYSTGIFDGNVSIGTSTAPVLATFQQQGMIGNTSAMFGAENRGISLITNWPGVYFNSYYNGGSKFMSEGYAGLLNFNPDAGDMTINLSTATGTAGSAASFTNPFYLANNGNIGIGVTNPGYKIDVNGAMRLRSSSAPTGANGVIYYDSTANKFKCYENGAWVNCVAVAGTSYWTASGNDIYNNNSGNVGIGDTSPDYPLDVNGSIRLSGNGLYNSAGYQLIQGNATDWIRIGNAAFTNGAAIYNNIATDGGLSIGSWSKPGAGNVYIVGNVGIGASSPDSKLDVHGKANIGDPTGGPCCATYYTLSINEDGSNQPTIQFHDADISEGQIILRGDIGGGQRGFRFQSVQTSMGGRFTGNLLVDNRIGIGTESPGFQLDVNGTAQIRQNFLVPNGSAQVGLPEERLPGSGKLLVYGGLELGTGRIWEVPVTPNSGYYDNGNFIIFRDRTGSMSEDFVGYKDNAFYFADAVGGSDTSNPDIWAANFRNYSSRAFKENIQKLTPEEYQTILEQIKKMDLVYFNYKNSDDRRSYLGVIAEEAPAQIVDKNRQGVSIAEYINFVAAGLKALQQENESLKLRIEKLESQLINQ